MLVPTGSPPAAPAPAAATPLLSVRRDPAWLERSITDARVAAAIAPLTARMPDMCVEVARDGAPVYQLRPEMELEPASNMKILTATAALDKLGPGYRFTTGVEATARPAAGKLTGNLYLVGSGDPDLMTRAYDAGFFLPEPVFTSLDQLAQEVKAAGITTVDGSVVGDASRFDQMTSVSTWLPIYEQEGDVGPLSALEVDDGTPPAASPSTPPVTGPADPALNGAATFVSVLAAAGVKVTGRAATGVTPSGADVVASVRSNPLSAELGQMLRVSDDTAAELFVKELGDLVEDRGTTAAGEAVVRADLAADGLPVSQFVGLDGSGLDTGDRATCSLVLAALERAGTIGVIAAGLPVADRTGTLTYRLAGTPAAGRLHAKTGTLGQVSALSGYVDPSPAAAGAGLAGPVWFSIIINAVPSATAVSVVDRIAAAIASYPSAVALNALKPLP